MLLDALFCQWDETLVVIVIQTPVDRYLENVWCYRLNCSRHA